MLLIFPDFNPCDNVSQYLIQCDSVHEPFLSFLHQTNTRDTSFNCLQLVVQILVILHQLAPSLEKIVKIFTFKSIISARLETIELFISWIFSDSEGFS